MASRPSVADRPIDTVDFPSAYTLNSASEPESPLGNYPSRPNWEQEIVPSSDGDMRPELSRKHWTAFVAGKLVYIAVVVYAASQLSNVCFDDDIVVGVDDRQGSLEGEEPPKQTGIQTRRSVFATMMFGLLVDVWLPAMYSMTLRSPRDLLSLHKIPLETVHFRYEGFYVHFVGAFMFSMLYYFCGGVSRKIYLNSSCEGRGGSGLETYLMISGKSMTLVGHLFLGIAVAGLCFTLRSTAGRTADWCAAVRIRINRHILSNSRFLDMFWKVQTVVWMYRAGGVGLFLSIMLGMCSLVSVVLTVIGIGPQDMRRISMETRTPVIISGCPGACL